MPVKEEEKKVPIIYNCYHQRSTSGEQFVAEHTLSYLVQGTMTMSDISKNYTFTTGDLRFYKRNHLVKFAKQPPADGGDFKTISVYFDQDMLQQFSIKHGIKATHKHDDAAIMHIKPHPLFNNYMQSVLPYLQGHVNVSKELMALKQEEALLLLLQLVPELKDTLFDFTEPGKIDLEAFMNKNFHFNVQMQRFAYLTGRSLATFKRDFEKIYHTTPSRWLQHRRLQEAHYLIKEKGKAPSDVYLDVGFEDLSHFSFAFKKVYGVAPSRLIS